MDNATFLHVVGQDTKFSEACFFHIQPTSTAWDMFLEIWASSYAELPDEIAFDQGTHFSFSE